MKTILSLSLAFCLAVVASAASFAASANTQPDNLYPKVRFVTSMGDMVVELDRWRAPKTVEHFLEHVVSGSYNDTLFNRVIDDFVVQGGGYKSNWDALPEGPTVINESGNGLRNEFGTIAMARQQAPHSARRQFYFNVKDNDSLNPSPRRWGYAVFGRVIENAELLYDLAAVETHTHEETGFPDVPVTPIVLERVELIPEEN